MKRFLTNLVSSLRRGLLVAALLVGLMLPTFAAAQNVNLNMVSVGVNRYRTPGNDLQWCVPDAQDMARAMSANAMFGRKDVNLLLNEQATAQNIMRAIDLLEQRATPNTYTVLYLSGHGTRDGNGHFLYCPHDYDARTFVAGEVLYARLKKMPGRVFLIIDSCYSGATGVTNTHFVKPNSSNQTVVISSSLARETSAELAQFRNGAFTQAFLEAISGKADANKDGTITLQEMHNYVYTRVGQLTNGKQHMITFVPTVALGNMKIGSAPRAVASSAAVWQGRENLAGFGALSFAFENGGRVVMTDTQGQTVGTWSQQGDIVTLRFNGGRVVYTGRMVGNNFSGTARNQSTQWSFAVARR
ncbi:MAG: caspase family protein [Planctomycetes bacterium]|nr:caspase family protein [Planctomycetota bacterium]